MILCWLFVVLSLCRVFEAKKKINNFYTKEKTDYPKNSYVCLCVLLFCDLPLISCLSKQRTRLRVEKFFNALRDFKWKRFAYMKKPLAHAYAHTTLMALCLCVSVCVFVSLCYLLRHSVLSLLLSLTLHPFTLRFRHHHPNVFTFSSVFYPK